MSLEAAGAQVKSMFCPKCGQQSPEEVRFCPRCGLALAGLPAYVVANEAGAGGVAAPRPKVLTARRRDIRRGAKMMFFSVVLLPLFILFGVAVDGPEPLLLPLALFLAGLAWIIYARLFGDNTLPVAGGAPGRDLSAPGERPALGAPTFVPAASFNQQQQQQRVHTAEMTRPPSVTENTTQLLDKDS